MPTEPKSSRPSKEIEEVAAELAGAVASAIAAADPGGEPPVIEEALPISGSVEIAIAYKETHFGLSGTLPGSDPDDAYEFKLTLQRANDPNPIEVGSFRLVAPNDWTASVTMPSLKIGQHFVIEKIEVAITMEPPPFAISVEPTSGRVPQGGSAEAGVSSERTRGEGPQTVTLSTGELPDGVTATFDPESVESGGEPSTLSITTDSTTPPGTHPITVTGDDGTSRNSITYTLTVGAD